MDELAVQLFVDSLTELLNIERKIVLFPNEQVKAVWMMKAWLGETV